MSKTNSVRSLGTVDNSRLDLPHLVPGDKKFSLNAHRPAKSLDSRMVPVSEFCLILEFCSITQIFGTGSGDAVDIEELIPALNAGKSQGFCLKNAVFKELLGQKLGGKTCRELTLSCT